MRVRPRPWLADSRPVRKSVATKLHSSLSPCFDMLPCSFLSSGGIQGQRRVDQADVGECLREVAQRLAADRIEFLAVQANVAGVAQQRLKRGSRPIRLARQRQGLHRPEADDAKGPLTAAFDAVRA